MVDLSKLLAVSRGDESADLLLKNAKLINVRSAEIYETDVAIYDDRIAAIGAGYQSKETVDLKGLYLAPGFIEGHIHIESSMMRPSEFARAVVPHGTTAVVADPHEIANVLGLDGIRYILESAKDGPLSIFVMLSSCVPATHMETGGAHLTAEDLQPYLNHPWVRGIAELMNYPGVVHGDPDMLAKIEIGKEKRLDGHAPRLSGHGLNAYVAAGVGSDHESTTLEEAHEKLRLGQYVMIREGTTAKNMKALLPLVNRENSRRFMFVSDDRHPDYLTEHGHMDHSIRMAVSMGLDPLTAIQMCTCNTAEWFNLRGIGAVTPGHYADLVVFSDLKQIDVRMVYRGGRLVARDGQLVEGVKTGRVINVRSAMNVAWDKVDFKVRALGRHMRVINVVPNQLVTTQSVEEVKRVGEYAVSDVARDILKMAVIERHMASGSMGIGFVRGFGLKGGALASSVGHDSHNIIVIGTNDNDMAVAARATGRLGGGFVAVSDGEVMAQVPLPIAGLMSDQPLEVVRKQVEDILQVSHQLGVELDNPFMALSFLALPVIPSLKLTDKGLVDVEQFTLVPLFVD
ncbi:MAG: adenine deaminase [Chloroflexi bacterium]|nr:adenine deaminase [Chloroflexota bacterium]